ILMHGVAPVRWRRGVAPSASSGRALAIPLFLYRCPKTGHRVQGFSAEDVSEERVIGCDFPCYFGSGHTIVCRNLYRPIPDNENRPQPPCEKKPVLHCGYPHTRKTPRTPSR